MYEITVNTCNYVFHIAELKKNILIFTFILSSRKAIIDLAKRTEKRSIPKNSNAKKGQLKKGANPEASINKASSQLKHKEKRIKVKDKFKSQYEGRIVKSLEYYELLLKELTSVEYVSKLKSHNDEQKVEDQHQSAKIPSTTDSSNLLSSSQVAVAMVSCEQLPEEEQEIVVKNVEMNMDLSDFNQESEWTIEMTEEAHKWFRKHT